MSRGGAGGGGAGDGGGGRNGGRAQTSRISEKAGCMLLQCADVLPLAQGELPLGGDRVDQLRAVRGDLGGSVGGEGGKRLWGSAGGVGEVGK